MLKRTWRKIKRFHINRKYKDHLFRYIFQDKKDLLDLYNAVNDTAYQNPDELIFTTLQDAVYLGMKNDIGFLIDSYMNLYEHQSTFCPNMPLRGVFYISDMLKAYVEVNRLDIYSTSVVKIPVPKYIIFYNGTREQPDRMELRLSDAFIGKEKQECALECTAVMLNINYGHNSELMNKCKRLSDYAYFVHSVRAYLSEGKVLESAVNLAVEECIEKDILTDVLRRNRAEVMDLLLTIYDKKLHDKTLRKEGKEEGREEGRKEGREEGREETRQSMKKIILSILGKKGYIPEKLCEKIMYERDLEILSQWVEVAAMIRNVEDFAKEIEVTNGNDGESC